MTSNNESVAQSSTESYEGYHLHSGENFPQHICLSRLGKLDSHKEFTLMPSRIAILREELLDDNLDLKLELASLETGLDQCSWMFAIHGPCFLRNMLNNNFHPCYFFS